MSFRRLVKRFAALVFGIGLYAMITFGMANLWAQVNCTQNCNDCEANCVTDSTGACWSGVLGSTGECWGYYTKDDIPQQDKNCYYCWQAKGGAQGWCNADGIRKCNDTKVKGQWSEMVSCSQICAKKASTFLETGRGTIFMGADIGDLNKWECAKAGY